MDAGTSNGTNPKDWNLGYPALPSHVVGTPDLSLIGQFNFDFTLVLTDVFDTIGTMTGLGKEGGLLDGRQAARTGQGVVVDALGAAIASSSIVYVKSAAGLAEGARRARLLFIVAMFFTPLYSSVPIEAAAPAPSSSAC